MRFAERVRPVFVPVCAHDDTLSMPVCIFSFFHAFLHSLVLLISAPNPYAQHSALGSAETAVIPEAWLFARLIRRSASVDILLPSQGRDLGSLLGFTGRGLCCSRLFGLAAGGTKHF